MNHSLKNPDAHRRLARGANAGVWFRDLGRRYMAGVEFKGRQMWLDFKDAVGPALEAIADGVDKSRKWFKAWLKGFVRPVEVPAMQSVQMGLNFGAAVGFGSVVVNLRQRRA